MNHLLFLFTILFCWVQFQWKRVQFSSILIYFFAAFAPMNGGFVADSHDSEDWNQPLNTDRYFSQTERYQDEENKWTVPTIMQRGGIVFLLHISVHLPSILCCMWQQFLRKWLTEITWVFFWFTAPSIRKMKLFWIETWWSIKPLTLSLPERMIIVTCENVKKIEVTWHWWDVVTCNY